MSLTSLLKDTKGPVRHWFEQTFPALGPLQADWRVRVAGLPTVRPPDGLDRALLGLVGTAVDYRIRYALTLTPPDRLVAYHGAMLATLSTFEPAASGRGLVASSVQLEVDADGPEHERVVAPAARRFAAALTADLAILQPIGRWLDAEHEAWLDRWCLILAAFDTFVRTGKFLPLAPSVCDAFRAGRLEARTAEVDAAAVADVGQLVPLFLSQDWPWERTPAAPSPWWPNPTFDGSGDVGGADADLIVDGCLIDVKATIAPAYLDREWAYQLLGYVLLDYRDEYRLDAIGIYLARQGRLIRWSVAEWLPILTGRRDVSLAGLRAELRQVIGRSGYAA